MNNFFTKIRNEDKNIYLIGDLNLNSLNYENQNVKSTFDIITQNSLIPLINKPTRVTRDTATVIDHIFTNNFFK